MSVQSPAIKEECAALAFWLQALRPPLQLLDRKTHRGPPHDADVLNQPLPDLFGLYALLSRRRKACRLGLADGSFLNLTKLHDYKTRSPRLSLP